MARLVIGLILWVVAIVLTAWLFRSRGKSAILGGVIGALTGYIGLVISLAIFMITERRGRRSAQPAA